MLNRTTVPSSVCGTQGMVSHFLEDQRWREKVWEIPEGTPDLSWAESGSKRLDQSTLKWGAALLCFPLGPLLGKSSKPEEQGLGAGRDRLGAGRPMPKILVLLNLTRKRGAGPGKLWNPPSLWMWFHASCFKEFIIQCSGFPLPPCYPHWPLWCPAHTSGTSWPLSVLGLPLDHYASGTAHIWALPLILVSA